MARDTMIEELGGVRLSNLDQPLSDDTAVTKRDLIDYLDAMADRLLPGLADRPLSVVRVRPGQPAFMQKNLPAYAPDWIPTVAIWAEASHREIRYPLCTDRRTLLWFGNQRAVEFHPTLLRGERRTVTDVILDLDPPEGDNGWGPDGSVVRTAWAVRAALDDLGLAGAVKTSGSKGLHIFVPVLPTTSIEDAAAATRAIAARAERLDPAVATTAYLKNDRDGKVFVDATRSGGATVVAAYSPRVRPAVPVSFPISWAELADIAPSDFTMLTAVGILGAADPWNTRMPAPQQLPVDLVAEGQTIPVARVAAMHEGKRRKRAREAADD